MATSKGPSIEGDRKPAISEGRIRRKAAATAEVRRLAEEDEALERRNRNVVLKIFGALALAAGLFFGYRAVAASSVFHVRHITVLGNNRLAAEAMVRHVRDLAGPSLMTADLYAIRRELQSIPLVKSAQLTRVLPDTLRVKIEERVPVALVKQADNSLVWVSDDNVALGELDEFREGAIPPILTGLLADSDSEFEHAENQRQIALYRQILESLDETSPRLSTLIDEINLRQEKDVVMQLSDSRIQVHTGEKDFRQHLKLALDVLDAARRKDAAALSAYRVPDLEGLIENASRITYFNVLRPDRISVGFSSAAAAAPDAGEGAASRGNAKDGTSKGSAGKEVKKEEKKGKTSTSPKESQHGKAKRPVHRRY